MDADGIELVCLAILRGGLCPAMYVIGMMMIWQLLGRLDLQCPTATQRINITQSTLFVKVL